MIEPQSVSVPRREVLKYTDEFPYWYGNPGGFGLRHCDDANAVAVKRKILRGMSSDSTE
jgi:hypothetical protein